MGCKKHELAPKNPDKNKLLNLVNDIRKSGCYCGNDYYGPVAQVAWNDKLEEAAQNHCNDMNKHGFLEHTGSDNSTTEDRLDAVEYIWRFFGENIAQDYTTEESVMEAWLNSEGHCKNIMNKNFTEMGVATKKAYWTQVFAQPK